MLLRDRRIAARDDMATVMRKVIQCENDPSRLAERREARPRVSAQGDAPRAADANVERSTAIVASGSTAPATAPADDAPGVYHTCSIQALGAYGRNFLPKLNAYTRPLVHGMTTPMFTTYLLVRGIMALGEVWVTAVHLDSAARTARMAEKYACAGCGEVEDCTCITVSPRIVPFGGAV